jgi:hypothetical protein
VEVSSRNDVDHISLTGSSKQESLLDFLTVLDVAFSIANMIAELLDYG